MADTVSISRWLHRGDECVWRRTSHLTPHTSHLTPHTSHLTTHTSHLTPHTSHLTTHTSHLTPHTSPAGFIQEDNVRCSIEHVRKRYTALLASTQTVDGLQSMSHATRHTSHATRHTSHVTRHTSHVTRHTSHVTPHTSHVTRHTSHATRHTSHVTRHTSHVTRHTSHVTPPRAADLCAQRPDNTKTRQKRSQFLRILSGVRFGV
jgi:hypothetical protein